MPETQPLPAVAVIGAGAIGAAHARLMRRGNACRLAAIADPSPAAAALAEELGVPHLADYRALLEGTPPDAVIVATPNQTHLPIGAAFLERGIPVLVEKPIADTLEAARALNEAAARHGTPLLVGHHRRHNPILKAASSALAGGLIGELTTASILASFLKHEGYFGLSWRREAGGGPVLINLIHEIDLVHYVCGEIASVQAVTSNARRGFAVEDSAVVLLRLVNGALVTLALSDTVAAPWSWDLVSGESPNYPPVPAPVRTHFLGGTKGGLSLPDLGHWRYEGKAGWHEPLSYSSLAFAPADPYEEQLRHLAQVARGLESPLCTGADAARTLAATLAVHEAAGQGGTIVLDAQP